MNETKKAFQEALNRGIKMHKPSRSTLLEAFNKVCNNEDWKDEVKANIAEKDVDLTVEAIEYFTGNEVSVTALGDGRFYVYSQGYRMGPCGDY